MAVATSVGLSVHLPRFEGPLALLLYLIKKEEMDIFDIEIHRITGQYLEFVRQMRELDLEVAGEFVAMAATLIQIKSQLLLPQYNEAGEVIEVEDPRKVLVQKLLEYQKYQEASRLLYDRPWLNRDVWARGRREKLEEGVEEIELEESGLFSLIASYRRVLRSLQKRVHKVSAKVQSVASRIMEIKDFLILGRQVGLRTLISSTLTSSEERGRQLLITFLSALELAKMGFVRLFQADHDQEVYIEAVQTIERAAISKVEEYDSVVNTNDGVVAEELPGPPVSTGQDLQAQMSLELSFDDASLSSEGKDPWGAEMQGSLEVEGGGLVEAATDAEIEQAEAELAQDAAHGSAESSAHGSAESSAHGSVQGESIALMDSEGLQPAPVLEGLEINETAQGLIDAQEGMKDGEEKES